MKFGATMEFATGWVAAWNSHDLDRIISLCAEALHCCSPLVLGRIPESDGVTRDRATLITYVQTGLRKNRSLRFTVREALPGLGSHGLALMHDNARGGGLLSISSSTRTAGFPR